MEIVKQWKSIDWEQSECCGSDIEVYVEHSNNAKMVGIDSFPDVLVEKLNNL